MRRRILFFAFALAVAAGPAMAAQEQCVEPYAPVVPDGSTATRDQILQTRDLVTAFLTESDNYQHCLNLFLEQQARLAADSDDEPDEVLRASIIAKGEANQREKVRIGDEFNAAVRAYNAAQPPAEN